jgi:hypothetical protein
MIDSVSKYKFLYIDWITRIKKVGNDIKFVGNIFVLQNYILR